MTEDPVEFRKSYIQQAPDGSRRGKIVTLLGITTDFGGVRTDEIYTPVSAFLAFKELEARSGVILPHLPELLEGCDMQWSYEARDTNFAPLQAVKQLLDATGIETEAEFEETTGTHSYGGQYQEQVDEQLVVILSEEETQQIQNATAQPPLPVTPLPTLAPTPLPLPGESTAISTYRTLLPRTTNPPRTLPPRETNTPLISEEQFVFERGNGEKQTYISKRAPTRQRRRGLQQQSTTRRTEGNHRLQLDAILFACHPHQAEGCMHNSTGPGHHDTTTARTQTSQQHRQLQDAPNPPQSIDGDLNAFGMIGAFSSRVSKTLSILGNALAVPQLSGTSTSDSLNEAPLFARTITTDDAQAEAFIEYMTHLQVTHVANIYINDEYGTSFHQSLAKYANMAGIKLRGISYNVGKETETINNLKETQIRFVFATVVTWKPLLRAAYQQGVMGVPHYAWYMAEKFFLTSPGFELHYNESDIAHALSGIALINVYQAKHAALDQALNEFAANTTMQEEFIDSHVHRQIFDDYTFFSPPQNAEQYFFFDAVLSLALASCRTPGLFLGHDLYEELLQLEFQGVTGNVSFDEFGNRAFGGLEYRVDNLRLSQERSDDMYYRFDSSLATILNGMHNVTEVNPFLFNNGDNYQFTTIVPGALPPVEEELNLIPRWAKCVGYTLGSFIILLSIMTMAWTWQKRESYVIKAAQPPFLVLLCCGTLVYAAAVFPLSLGGGGTDEETNPQNMMPLV